MINLLGKTLALVHVGLSLALLGLAGVVYLRAVDLGWKEPLRYYRQSKDNKENVLVPSLFDKREAAVRTYSRFKRDQLASLARAHASLSEVGMDLGENYLQGEEQLARVENAEDKIVIFDIKYNDAGGVVLKPGSRGLGFPLLEVPLAGGFDRSYAGYLALLQSVDARMKDIQEKTSDLITKEKEVTDRLIGEADKGGEPIRDKSGSVIKPGWYYLIEVESKAQRDLLKELDYLRPLWVKELADLERIVSRRETLLKRLYEMGDMGYMSGSEFLKKQQ
jgi:hypothetical protein